MHGLKTSAIQWLARQKFMSRMERVFSVNLDIVDYVALPYNLENSI